MIWLFQVIYIFPWIVSYIYDEHLGIYYFLTMLVSLILGGLCYIPNRNNTAEIKTKHSYLLVSLIWTIYSAIGALPFIWIAKLSFASAFLETASGLTTAGATVLSGLDDMPKSFLFYRQLLQFVGGLGVIVLMVALMPQMKSGGMTLLKAEIPGPVKDEKLTPRVKHTARLLWYIYIMITALCMLAYWGAGMTLFDAVCHAMTTVSTGGFSTHDASIAYFQNPVIEFIAIVFMLIGAINFSLFYRALFKLDFSHLYKDFETRVFIVIVLSASLIVSVNLMTQSEVAEFSTAWRHSWFTVVSFITSTGYGLVDLQSWPTFSVMLLIYVAFAGGCAGSTAGGLKIVRIIILWKELMRELKRYVHPNGYFIIRYRKNKVASDVINGIRGFFYLYAITTFFMTLALTATGLDYISAFGAVAGSINVLGPGLNKTAASFAELSDTAKWLMAATMLIGRLELYTFFVLLAPSYWRRVLV